MFTPIPDHVEQALARLIQQYKSATNLKNFLTAIVTPIQSIEDELTQMNTLRYLPDATGAQLDVIGIIVGIARQAGQSDASYLQSIYAQIALNSSDGTPEQIIQAFKLFTGADQIILVEGVGSIIIETTWVPANQEQVDFVITSLMHASCAGVRIDGIVSYDPSMAFAYDGVLAGFGYDDGSQTVGGKYPTLWQFIGAGFEYAGNDPDGLGYGSLKDPLVGGAYLT